MKSKKGQANEGGHPKAMVRNASFGQGASICGVTHELSGEQVIGRKQFM